MTRSNRARPLRRLLFVLVPLALIVAVAWMILTFGNPFPPDALTLATGAEGSASQNLGRSYQEILGRAGVELTLEPTAGGVENLARLRDPASGVDAAFVESGVTNRKASPELVSLGAVTLDPLWIFSREPSEGPVAGRLRGRRISIEPEGSGARLLSLKLLELNGVKETEAELLAYPPAAAAEALLRGEIDMAIMLTSWHSPTVRKLLLADGVILEATPRADAYVALFPSLGKVILPEGVADLERNVPPRDLPLLAIESNLLVKRDLHPALQYLLLEAAAEIHGTPDIFHTAGRFPSRGSIDLPLSDHAQTYFTSGRPFLYRYLPLWLAGLAERLLIVLIPLFAVVLPVAHFGPMLFAYVTEHRIFGLYRELKLVERELELPGAGADLDRLEAVLGDLDRRANHLWVPLSFAQRLFTLKSHVALARQQIDRRRKTESKPQDD